MDLVTLAYLIIAVAVAVLVAVLVPTIIQLKNTLASADVFLKNLDDELKPMLKSVNGTFEELEGTARAAREGAEKVEGVLDAVSEVGDAIRTVNHIINSSIKVSIIEIAASIAGFRAGLETLLNVFKRRGQKEV